MYLHIYNVYNVNKMMKINNLYYYRDASSVLYASADDHRKPYIVISFHQYRKPWLPENPGYHKTLIKPWLPPGYHKTLVTIKRINPSIQHFHNFNTCINLSFDDYVPGGNVTNPVLMWKTNVTQYHVCLFTITYYKANLHLKLLLFIRNNLNH